MTNELKGIIKKRKGRWGTYHWFIDGVDALKGDYQKTGNMFDTVAQAEGFARGFGIDIIDDEQTKSTELSNI